SDQKNKDQNNRNHTKAQAHHLPDEQLPFLLSHPLAQNSFIHVVLSSLLNLSYIAPESKHFVYSEMTFFRFKSLSTSRISASFPGVRDPTRSYTPILLAGFLVAAKIACSLGTPKDTAHLIQSNRFVAEPASVPSCSVALRSFMVTSRSPSLYRPYAMPVAIMESLIRTTLSDPKSVN